MSREQFWFFYPLRVRYSEVDCQGVVFNANYLMYFDTTITEYFRALGYDQYADAKQTGEDFHVVKSLIEYKAPASKGRVQARPCDTGFAHLALDVDDVEAAVAAAARYDVVAIHAPVAIDQGPNQGKKVVYLRDADGVTLEFIGK